MSQKYSIKPLFNDDAIGYDCAACEGKCCRQNGDLHLNNDADLVNIQAISGNAIHVFGNSLDNPSTTTVKLSNTECFYLADDFRCSIEVEHGREKKPLNCILFPFNRLITINKTIYVDAAPSCPISSSFADSSTAHRVSHEELHANIRLIEERLGSYDEYKAHSFAISPEEHAVIDGAINYLLTRAEQANHGSHWSEYFDSVSDHCSDLLASPNISLAPLLSQLSRLYNVTLPPSALQNSRLNQELAALAPSLFFRLLLNEGIATKGSTPLSVLGLKFLIHIIGIRFVAAVSDHISSYHQKRDNLNQLSSQRPSLQFWMLFFEIRFIKNSRIEIKLPKHLQRAGSKLLGLISQNENKRLGQLMEESNIEPADVNAFLQVFHDHQQFFDFSFSG